MHRIDRLNAWAAALPPARRRLFELGLLAAATIAIRAWQFGNPAIQVDEQFYLLVGDRMLHGALPYVDIWDRKPVGLFLLYAATRLLGGAGIHQYQLVAGLFALATAVLVTRMAGRIARPAGALAAGVLYLLYLNVFGGDGGQSPVFYNLPVAGAFAILMALWRRPGFGRGGTALGAGAMALVGLAIQIKDTALFEGIYFGLALLVLARARGASHAGLVARGALWVAVAVLPTLAAFATYAALGHGNDWLYANIVSITARGHPAGSALARLVHIVLLLSPFAIAIAVRPAAGVPGERSLRRLADGWAIAACLAVLAFGAWFDHYALPLLAPLAVAAAPALDRARGLSFGRLCLPAGLLAITIALVAGTATIWSTRDARGTGPEQRALAAFIRPRLHGCLFVYDGEPILYLLTESCLPTRWPFPDHLDNISEDGATGVDPLAEVTRIMAAKPALVVRGTNPSARINPRTWRFMSAVLQRDYHPAFAVREGHRLRIVYVRVARSGG